MYDPLGLVEKAILHLHMLPRKLEYHATNCYQLCVHGVPACITIEYVRRSLIVL